jgi:hypothetical protein
MRRHTAQPHLRLLLAQLTVLHRSQQDRLHQLIRGQALRTRTRPGLTAVRTWRHRQRAKRAQPPASVMLTTDLLSSLLDPALFEHRQQRWHSAIATGLTLMYTSPHGETSFGVGPRNRPIEESLPLSRSTPEVVPGNLPPANNSSVIRSSHSRSFAHQSSTSSPAFCIATEQATRPPKRTGEVAAARNKAGSRGS